MLFYRLLEESVVTPPLPYHRVVGSPNPTAAATVDPAATPAAEPATGPAAGPTAGYGPRVLPSR
jgi:hypothetical protein